MGIRVYRPISKGRRNSSVLDYADVTRSVPEKSLLEPLRKTGGRNNTGRVTTRHIGGGNRRAYRLIDFKRDKDNVAARVESIEYDPNRSVRIALLLYKDGERRYILAPNDVKVGDELMSGDRVEPRSGNTMPLRNLPLGMQIHNIELTPGRGGQLVRSAGCSAQLLAREGEYAHVLLPSGEMRKIHLNCRATLGQLGNIEWSSINWGKAGRRRWLGIRPTVRGTAQNPVSHPMGGGEGRTGGGRHPCSPTGVLAKGGKTRQRRKPSSAFILRGRKKGRFQKT
jgi:large subunit ribosomal protein L2